MILLIDNYDSFVHNLARYLERLGQRTRVLRNDASELANLDGQGLHAIILSPGPCTPDQAGRSLELVRRWHARIPMLGVCLGHQAIAAALGGRIVRAPQPVHGCVGEVFHDGRGIFADIPSPFAAGRYHSLTVERQGLPAVLEVSAWLADGTVMAVRHRALPVVGVQFHPESVLTPWGYRLLAQFLRLAGAGVRPQIPTIDDECCRPAFV